LWSLGSAIDDQRALLMRLLPFEDQIVYNGVTTMGAVAHFLGLLATTLERLDDAERYFDRALETHARITARYFLADTQLERGRLSVQRHTADGAAAQSLLEAALATARENAYGRIERLASLALDESRSQ
jgi:hypothetical protein